jgi:hypothetical protein
VVIVFGNKYGGGLSEDTVTIQILRRDIAVVYYQYKKGKAIPLQARTGPEGSRKLRLPHFKTIGT